MPIGKRSTLPSGNEVRWQVSFYRTWARQAANRGAGRECSETASTHRAFITDLIQRRVTLSTLADTLPAETRRRVGPAAVRRAR